MSFDIDDKALECQAGKLLLAYGLTVGCAESCTGGLLTARLTAVPGSSAYVLGSIVCYTNEVKVKQLGVSAETLKRVGAVSEETAREMAEGVRRAVASDIGIGITGIAGPDGATDTKPLGLVYISVAGAQGTVVIRNIFAGNRQEVRWKATEKALTMLIEYTQKL